MSCGNNIGTDLFDLINKFRLLNQKYKNAGELSHAEFFVLMTIAKTMMEKQMSEKEIQEREMHEKEMSGITTTEIVKTLGTSLSAGSKLLRSVEEKGYIERAAHPKDRRVTYILLSEKGDAILKKQMKECDALMDSVVERVGKDNMIQLKNLLEQVYETIREEMEAKNKL